MSEYKENPEQRTPDKLKDQAGQNKAETSVPDEISATAEMLSAAKESAPQAEEKGKLGNGEKTEPELEVRMLDAFTKILALVDRTEDEALYKSHFNDLSSAEMHMLMVIGPYDTLTITEIAGQLGLTAGTVSVTVDRLVKKNYVEKKKRVSDRRVSEISLTRKGKIIVRARKRFNKALLKTIIEPLNCDQQIFLLEVMLKVEKYLAEKYADYKSR